MDFYLPETGELIQVAQSMEHPQTRQREIRALTDALKSLNMARGLILTEQGAPSVENEGITIEIRSFTDWLLEKS